MSDVLILEFNGATAEHYATVNKLLGIDPTTGDGDWPAGLLDHVGASSATGDLTVVEVWDSQASQAAFMTERLGPALHQAAVPEPSRIEWLTLQGRHTQ